MEASQSSAVSAALASSASAPPDVVVEGVAAGAPADGRLREGTSCARSDGRPLRDAADLRTRSRAARSVTSCGSAFERDGRSGAVELRTEASDDDGEPRPVIGVVTREEPVDAPFDVEITLEDVGGPSAGLMFALGILDKLGEPSLTGGAYIAGRVRSRRRARSDPSGHRPEARRREGQGRRRLPRTGGQLRGGGPCGTGRPAARRGGQPGAGAHRARGAARGRAAELCPAG
jgi:hypothetical protein